MSEWKPIATAPRDGREVIVGHDSATVWIVRSASYTRADEWFPPEPNTPDGWWSYDNSVSQSLLDGLDEPTHWLMETPEPPGAGGDEAKAGTITVERELLAALRWAMCHLQEVGGEDNPQYAAARAVIAKAEAA
jgi:hypothetical protein